MGLFVTTFMKKGTVLGEYKGKTLTLEQFDRSRKEDYIWEISYPTKGHHTYVDAYFKKANNELRYVNAVYKEEEKVKKNTLMFQKHKRVWYKLCRSVLPGTELIVDYGD